MKKLSLLVGAAFMALSAGSAASAAMITYTASGTANAVVVGLGVFDGAFTAVGVGDTATLFNPVGFPSVNAVVLNSLTLTIGGQSVTGLEPTVFFSNAPFNAYGFNSFHPGVPFDILAVLGFNFAVPNGYDALGSLGPTAVAFSGSQTGPGIFSYATDAGPAFFQRVNITSFEASLGNGGAVPEPASWAMMIAGFGIAGAAMRRKTKVAVSYS
jgi:PEP-CTERM motif